ncbi:MAG: hypothetical protein K0R17_1218 [Rariglobus sp.]|jgi:hypothetical protein|nr:hypothetical protein [Rariglobus sp.]
MKITKLILAAIAASLTLSLSATTFTDFSSDENIDSAIFNDTWSGAYVDNTTFGTIGASATDFGSLIYVLSEPISMGSDTMISVIARLDAGNTATGFSVILYNDFSNYAYANFSSSLMSTSFSTLSVEYITEGLFDPSSVIAFGISGGSPSSTTTFRISFDSISTSAVPEPAAYAGLFGAAAIGFCVWRKRRAA